MYPTALPFPPVLSDAKDFPQRVCRNGDEQQKKLAHQQLPQRQKSFQGVHQKQGYADNDRRQRQNTYRQMQDLHRLQPRMHFHDSKPSIMPPYSA